MNFLSQEKIEKEHRHQAELSGTTAITAYQCLAKQLHVAEHAKTRFWSGEKS